MPAYDAEQHLLDQLLHQFKFSENIVKLIGVLGDTLQDTFDAAYYIQTAVSLDDYEGEQLEFWGELIGVSRPLAQEPKENLFTLRKRGESVDPDNKTGFEDSTDSVITGGYLTTREGLPSISDPGSEMSDIDYRFLIRQKAASYRSRMTHTNLYNYLLAFGARCKIDGTVTFKSTIEQQNYYDLNNWQRNYIETRGFAPSGLTIEFDGNLEDVKDI
jgi:hypothetical protein